MSVLVLAKVKRSVVTAAQDPTGLVQKINGCACYDLVKRKKSRRKLRNSTKQYLQWLDNKVPQLAADIHEFFEAEAKRVAKELASAAGLEKAKKSVKSLIDGIDWTRWKVVYGVLSEELQRAHRENSKQGVAMVGISETEDMLDQLDERALDYAQERAAELVGMRVRPDGKLVRNPDPDYAITETTRKELRGIIADALENGWGAAELQEEIVDSYAFSPARAATIARTELAFAHTEGNYAGWLATGLVGSKQSILGSEHDLDDVCDGNAEAGPIPLEDEFPSGHKLPPYHPNCVCDVIPIVTDADYQRVLEEE